MCTLILAWAAFPDAPVVVAANRDESTDRPSSPPTAWDGEAGVVAPRDRRAGGTWIGHNARGLVVGVSNRWLDAPVDADRSRGLLVADALAAPSADAAVDTVRSAVSGTSYAGFNLLVADRDRATLLVWDGGLRAFELDPGVHVVANAGFDGTFEIPEGRAEAARAQVEIARVLRERLEPTAAESATDWLDRAAASLADHDLGVCIHGDGYGTRSASLVLVPASGDPTYRFADGPPCRRPFVPVNGQS